jgi:hypothetical protein
LPLSVVSWRRWLPATFDPALLDRSRQMLETTSCQSMTICRQMLAQRITGNLFGRI